MQMELIKPSRQATWGWPAAANFILGGMGASFYLLSLFPTIQAKRGMSGLGLRLRTRRSRPGGPRSGPSRPGGGPTAEEPLPARPYQTLLDVTRNLGGGAIHRRRTFQRL